MLSQPRAIATIPDFLEEKIYIADNANGGRVIKVTLPETTPPDSGWSAMRTSLQAGNIDEALQKFANTSIDKYRKAFRTIGATGLSAVAMQMPVTITAVAIRNDTAQYRFEQTIQGLIITFPVNFIKENGTWKIMEY